MLSDVIKMTFICLYEEYETASLLPQLEVVLGEDLQLPFPQLHDQLHAVQQQLSHCPSTWLSSFQFPGYEIKT